MSREIDRYFKIENCFGIIASQIPQLLFSDQFIGEEELSVQPRLLRLFGDREHLLDKTAFSVPEIEPIFCAGIREALAWIQKTIGTLTLGAVASRSGRWSRSRAIWYRAAVFAARSQLALCGATIVRIAPRDCYFDLRSLSKEWTRPSKTRKNSKGKKKGAQGNNADFWAFWRSRYQNFGRLLTIALTRIEESTSIPSAALNQFENPRTISPPNIANVLSEDIIEAQWKHRNAMEYRHFEWPCGGDWLPGVIPTGDGAGNLASMVSETLELDWLRSDIRTLSAFLEKHQNAFATTLLLLDASIRVVASAWLTTTKSETVEVPKMLLGILGSPESSVQRVRATVRSGRIIVPVAGIYST